MTCSIKYTIKTFRPHDSMPVLGNMMTTYCERLEHALGWAHSVHLYLIFLF